MARSYLTESLDPKKIPQSEPVSKIQVPNSAGGFSFQLDKWSRLERFLILGAESGTYYINERSLVKENVSCLEECIKEDGVKTVNVIASISDDGRAPKNDPALFALAMCFKKGDLKTKREAANSLPLVARIGTHLFHFAQFMDALKVGWGPVVRRAVSEWYIARDVDKLAYQLVKYQSRDGWSHRDLIRLSHPKPIDQKQTHALGWATGSVRGEFNAQYLPSLLAAFDEAKTATAQRTIELIREHNLPRECVKTEYLNDTSVWEALLEKMPVGAMIRNLGNMTKNGLIAPNSEGLRKVISLLGNRDALKKARIHPLNVFLAQATYKTGRGMKGSNTWTPVMGVLDALEGAFYTTFDLVEPTNKRYFLGLDVSGSMGSAIGSFPITCREGTALMAMVTMRTEKIHFTGGFTAGRGASRWSSSGIGSGFTPLNISATQTLDAVVKVTSSLEFGGTDCALPMLFAMEHKIPADVFVIYTDSETWAGHVHPHIALEDYRQKMGIPAKLVVVGMTSNGFTIANPNDAGMLDIAGFDTTVPSVLADFATDGKNKENKSGEPLEESSPEL
jgi:60 kDa SS-A/Ro ribonucleoprotein